MPKKKWYDVDMNNSKNQGMFGNQMQKDLKEMFKNYNDIAPPPSDEPEPKPENGFIEDFETWFIYNNYVNLFNENFESW